MVVRHGPWSQLLLDTWEVLPFDEVKFSSHRAVDLISGTCCTYFPKAMAIPGVPLLWISEEE